MILLRTLFLAIAATQYVYCFENQTPQMGWNSWNKFGCDISEELIKETADALVESGLKDLGYDRINLDDCYLALERGADGQVVADPERFPSGLKSLSDYVRGKGLKFGLYSSAGFKTCQAYPASLGMESVDVASWTDWAVDYLKYDNCYQDHGSPQKRFTPMAEAIQAAASNSGSSDQIFFSLCEWGRENPAVWASEIGGNSWRTTPDIRDDWNSIMGRAAIQASLWRYAGPGVGWNDPDMLEVGNGGCSASEYRAHFSLWAMMKAPLLIGNDIRNMTDPTSMEILGNTEVIAVNQDRLGAQARLVWSDVSSTLQEEVSEYGDKLIATKCASGVPGAYEDDITAQQWSMQEDGTIRSTDSGRCLNELDGGILELVQSTVPRLAERLQDAMPHEAGAFEHDMLNFTSPIRAVSTAPCSEATKWSLGAGPVGGSIVSQNSGNCLEVAKLEVLPSAQGKRVQTAACRDIPIVGDVDVREHQSWTNPQGLTDGSFLSVYQRQCLTVDHDAHTGIVEVWVAPLASEDSLAVLLLNKSPLPTVMTLSTSMLGNFMDAYDQDVAFKMRDLWEQRDLLQQLSAKHDAVFTVEAHGVVMLTLKP